MVGKTHDWRHAYWRNRDASRVFDEEELEPPEPVLSVFLNERGEQVALQYVEYEEQEHEVEVTVENEDGEEVTETEVETIQVATGPPGVPEDTEAKYAVTYNGELVTGVDVGDGKQDLLFGTRGDARQAASELRKMMPPIPDEEELDEMEWDELLEVAKARGFTQNDGREAIEAGLAAI